jgi:histidinol-phosphate aminotransferase
MPTDFQEVPHPGIRSLIPYKPGKSIEELAREKGITDIIKLASNENPLGCSPLALAAIRDLPSHIIATYPSPINHPLMPKLAEKLGVATDQLFLSNGSDYLFGLLMMCFALHSDKHILTHEYAFSTYAIQAHSLHIPVNTVAIDFDWSVNVDNLLKACTPQTGLIFLANPNNPTGLLMTQEEIKRLLDHIPKHTLLVLDEAYYEFAASQLSCNSIEWLDDYPNLVVTRTFSKIYGMAGLRLGYMMANQAIINIVQRVQLPFAVNQMALNAAYAALDDEAFLKASLKMNAEGMKQLQEGFNQLNITCLPSACNFLTFDCKEEDSLPLYNYLLEKGIIVRPLHPYQMVNYIRVTVGTKEQNIRFLKALKNYYQS